MLGAAVTAGTMWQLLSPLKEPTAPPTVSSENETESSHQDTVTEVLPAEFRRDISGDCTLVGTVTNQEGAPITDAFVGIWLHDQPWSDPQPKPLGKTDKTGGFRIEKINGNLPLSLWSTAKGFRVETVSSPNCDVPANLTLNPGGEAIFTVTTGDNQPIYNAHIHLFGDGLWPQREGRTDENGRLYVTGITPGEYAILAEKNDQIFSSKTLFEVQANKTAEVAVSLAPADKHIVVVVDKEEGTPVQGAFVVVSAAPTSFIRATVQTDAAGRVEVSCPGEVCMVSASSPRYLQTDPRQVSGTGETLLSLTRGKVVSGRIINRQGEPVKGAEIRITEEMGTAFVSLPGSEASQFQQKLFVAGAAGHPAMISTDQIGTAVLGPITLPLPNSAEKSDVQAGTAADDTGRFTLFGLPNRRIALTAVHPEMVPDGPPVKIALDADEVASDVLIVMKQGARINIRVLDEREVPVLNASVLVYTEEGEPIRDAATDTDGYAHFVGLPFGTRIEIAKEEYIPRTFQTDTRSQDEEVSITLAPADRVINGRVKDSRGFGVGNVAVTARLTERGRLQVLTAVTESDGTFTLEGAGDGRYRITADGGDQGGAQALDMTYRDDVKLVLDTSKQPPVADLDTPLVIAPPGWNGGAGISDIGGEYTNAENVGADNLGTTGSKGAALVIPAPSAPTVAAPDTPEAPSVPFGQADTLSVTGPPPGKGGLPIGIGGGAGKVTVTSVAVGSRVEIAGLTRGARILAVNGQKITGPADAKRAVQGPIGTVVMLEVSDHKDGSDPYTIIVQRERIP